jgi:hypothetical protein
MSTGDTQSLRVAVCLSGQPRTIQYCRESIMEYFSDLGRIDYFCHAWDYNNYKTVGVLGTINDRVDHTTLNAELQKFNPISLEIDSRDRISAPHYRYSSLFYSALRANDLKRQHEITHNFRYDIVIKSRYDLVFPHNVRFQIHPFTRSKNYCSTHDIFVKHADRAPQEFWRTNVSDVIFWGTSTAVDTVCDIYWWITQHYSGRLSREDSEHLLGPGCLLGEYMSRTNLRYILDPQNLHEIVYRASAIPLDWRTNLREIMAKNAEIYV